MTDDPTPRRTRVLATALLVAACLALYSRALGHEFVTYDDPLYVSQNPHLEGGLTIENLRWAATATRGANWHPVTWASHLLDVQLFGLDPRGHHLTNVLLHAASTGLLVAALTLLSGAFWPSFFAAALFGLHPLRVESVAWVAERKDVLCVLLWMTTLLAYAWYVRRAGWRRYLLVLVSFALGLGAKSMGVTLPFVLLLFDAWPLARHRAAGWARLAWEKVPLLLLVAGVSAMTYHAQAVEHSVTSTERLPVPARLANAALSYASYLGKIAVPRDLACFYPHPRSVDPEFSFLNAQVGLAAALLVALTGLAVRVRRSHPFVLVGWLLYLGVMLPAIGIVQVGNQGMADRYTYLPAIGIGIAVVWSVRRWMSVSGVVRAAAPWVGATVLAALSALTWRQIGTWRDSVTLYEHAIAVTEHNYPAENNLGVLYELSGDVEEAERRYRRALEYRADYPSALTNMAKLEIGRGELDSAQARLELALAREPSSVSALSNLGAVHLTRGELDVALQRFEEALAHDPSHVATLRNVVMVLRRRGDVAAALVHQERLAELLPDDPDVALDLARALRNAGRAEDALPHYQRAVELAPEDPRAHGELFYLYLETNDQPRAVNALRAAVRLQPEEVVWTTELAWLLATTDDAQLRDGEEALRLARQAVLMTEGREAGCLATLAAAHAALGDLEQAAEAQRRAVDVATPDRQEEMRARLRRIEEALAGR